MSDTPDIAALLKRSRQDAARYPWLRFEFGAQELDQLADALERLARERDALKERLADTNMLAHKWMEAHDNLAAGKPYEYPKPADLPEAVAERDALAALNGMKVAQQGYDTWAAKTHNAKWVRRLDGTPIPNDLVVCIGEAIRAALQSTGEKT